MVKEIALTLIVCLTLSFIVHRLCVYGERTRTEAVCLKEAEAGTSGYWQGRAEVLEEVRKDYSKERLAEKIASAKGGVE